MWFDVFWTWVIRYWIWFGFSLLPSFGGLSFGGFVQGTQVSVGVPHAPAHVATVILGIVFRAGSHHWSWKGEPTWASLPSGEQWERAPHISFQPLPPAAQHGVSEKSLRGHPGLSLPHLRVLVPCCNFMGREEAGLTPWSTVSANSCRRVSSPDSKM